MLKGSWQPYYRSTATLCREMHWKGWSRLGPDFALSYTLSIGKSTTDQPCMTSPKRISYASSMSIPETHCTIWSETHFYRCCKCHSGVWRSRSRNLSRRRIKSSSWALFSFSAESVLQLTRIYTRKFCRQSIRSCRR